LKMQNNNFVEIDNRSARRIGHSRTVYSLALVTGAVIHEAARDAVWRDPRLLETGKNVDPPEPKNCSRRCLLDALPFRALNRVRRQRFVGIQPDEDSPSGDPARMRQQELLTMLFIEHRRVVDDSRNTRGSL